MVLSRVNLPDGAAHAGVVVPDHHEQVLGYETGSAVFIDNFDVGESLAIGANFILALYDANASFPQDPVGFQPGGEV